MNEFLELIYTLAREKEMSPSLLLDTVMRISNHESGGTFDTKLKQLNNGPARGAFQIEPESVPTLVNRLNVNFPKNYNKKQYTSELGRKLDREISDKGTVDITDLDFYEQASLALIRVWGDSKSKLEDIDKPGELERHYIDHYWAGYNKELGANNNIKNANKVRNDRKRSFKESNERYDKEFPAGKPIELEDSNIYEDKGFYDKFKSMGLDINKLPELKNPKTKYDKPLEDQTYRPDELLNNLNIFKSGGIIENSSNNNERFNSFNVGGTHSQNPLGGIPLGIGDNGAVNKVEQGESSYKFGNGLEYIFSNKVKI